LFTLQPALLLPFLVRVSAPDRGRLQPFAGLLRTLLPLTFLLQRGVVPFLQPSIVFFLQPGAVLFLQVFLFSLPIFLFRLPIFLRRL